MLADSIQRSANPPILISTCTFQRGGHTVIELVYHDWKGGCCEGKKGMLVWDAGMPHPLTHSHFDPNVPGDEDQARQAVESAFDGWTGAKRPI